MELNKTSRRLGETGLYSFSNFVPFKILETCYLNYLSLVVQF